MSAGQQPVQIKMHMSDTVCEGVWGEGVLQLWGGLLPGATPDVIFHFSSSTKAGGGTSYSAAFLKDHAHLTEQLRACMLALHGGWATMANQT